jgi:PAS domain S-box-containing protein
VPWRGPSGEIKGLLGISRDVTAQKTAQDRSHRNEERLQVIARTVPYPLGVSRLSDGALLFANDALAEFVGVPRSELLGTRTPDLYVDPGQRALVLEEFARIGRVDGIQARLRRADGEIRLMAIRAISLDYDGTPSMMGVAVDITELKRNEEALEDLSRQQQTLLREVTHRVGNNLTALLALLQQETASLRRRGEHAAVEVFLKIKARLLALAKVHTMLSTSEWGPLDLRHLAREVIVTTVGGFEPGYDLSVDGADTLVSSTQAQHLTMVLSELALNTTKHAGDGNTGIRVNVRVEGDAIELRYEDEGSGFPAEVLVDRAGSGLGLKLIDGIVGHSLRGEVALANDGGAITCIRFAREVQG